jgi:hypothetical protein
VLEVVPGRLRDVLPLPNLLGAEPGIGLHCGDLRLARQLVVVRKAACGQLARLDSHPNRTARLVAVSAVAEAARASQALDLRERRGDPRIRAGQRQRAKAGRVDQDPPAGQLDQFANNGGVSAPTVAQADLTSLLPALAEKRVDERRLPGS